MIVFVSILECLRKVKFQIFHEHETNLIKDNEIDMYTYYVLWILAHKYDRMCGLF